MIRHDMPRYGAFKHGLTREQEAELTTAAKSGCNESRDKLISSVMPLIVEQSWKLSRGDTDLQADLISEVVLKLCRSIHAYDPSRVKWITFAWRPIRWRMAQVMDRHRVSQAKVLPTVGLYGRLKDNDYEKRCAKQWEPKVDHDEQQTISAFREAVQTIEPRRRKMIAMYLAGKQHNEIAEQFGISRARVGQLVHGAVKQIVEVWPQCDLSGRRLSAEAFNAIVEMVSV